MDIKHTSGLQRTTVFVCVVLLSALFLTHFVTSNCQYGLADNGDFYRLSQSVGVHHLHWDDTTLYHSVRHDYKKAQTIEPPSGSAYLPARLAVLISDVRGEKTFSLVNLSTLYICLYLAGFLLLVGYVIGRFSLIVALALASTIFLVTMSPLYLAFFGSFYDEAFFFPCLLMALVLWQVELWWLETSAVGKPAWWLQLIPYAVCILLALAAASKLQNLVFLLLLVPYASLKKSKGIVALCVLLTSVSIYSQQDALDRYTDMNAYHRLFFGLLLTTEPEHSREILEELELTVHAGRIGTSFWQSAESLGELPPGQGMTAIDR